MRAAAPRAFSRDMAMDETDGGGRLPARRRRRAPVRYSERVARRICARVTKGEMLYAVCREAGMPTPQSVGRWAKERPDFGERLAQARRAGGRAAHGGGVWRYDPDTADEIFRRLCDGHSLTQIGEDPEMPCLSTIFHWRRRIPEFEQAVQLGKQVQAERFCDRGWELAEAATTDTAYLTDVKLKQLRWQAGVLAPRTYRPKTVEPPEPPKVLDLLIRRFAIEIDPGTGEKKVVAYCPNPETGEVVREARTRWRPGPDQLPMPGGAIQPPEPGWDGEG